MGEGASGGRMPYTWPKHYAKWPEYLPYPTEIPRNAGPVPNGSSVNEPQMQFAPLYLPPGSPSFQPYRYAPNGPLTDFQPDYFLLPAGALASQTHGPDGDIARVPNFSGASMNYSRMNPDEAAAAADALLDTPVEAAAAEQIVAEAAAVVPVSGFSPMDPELYSGLGTGAVQRIQRLEQLITKLEANQDRLGARAQKLQDQLCRIHDSIEYKLENNLGLKLRRRRAARFDKLLGALRRKRATKLAAPTMAEKKGDALDQVRADYQSGVLDRGTAKAKGTAILKAQSPEQYEAAKAAGLALKAYYPGGFTDAAKARAGDYTAAQKLAYAYNVTK